VARTYNRSLTWAAPAQDEESNAAAVRLRAATLGTAANEKRLDSLTRCGAPFQDLRKVYTRERYLAAQALRWTRAAFSSGLV